jgi:hypothetical protein
MNRAAAYRRLELPDGRLVEWSEVKSSGRPRTCLGYLDGQTIDESMLHELIGPACMAHRASGHGPAPAA